MSFRVSFCSCVFSVLLVLRLPRLGKRELILVLFVRLFGLCLFRFVGFLFLLVSGKGCSLWLWHSLDFSLTFFFIPGDSTTNQLTFLYNIFCRALDAGREVPVGFCDVTKATDRVWHKGLLYKLRAAGVSGSLLFWLGSYLSEKERQRVILPDKELFFEERVILPVWLELYPRERLTGVYPWSALILFYIFMTLLKTLDPIRHFADDTSLSIVVENPDTPAATLNSYLETMAQWAETWLVKFNPTKTAFLLISRKLIKPVHPSLYMLNQHIKEIDNHKHLGIHLSNDGSWHTHMHVSWHTHIQVI